jgi:DNA repair exonuclease SbcCD nuclease subunit
MRILCIGDTHYGLKSAGYDRTEEIHKVMLYAVKYAKKIKADLFVHLGDLGHTANPTSQIHAKWIEVFGLLEQYKIQSRFMLGNHDVINREGNPYGSLAPLAEFKFAYLQPIVKGRIEEWGQFPGVSLLFMPYISRANMELEKKKSIDEYYDYFLDQYEEELEEARNIIAFTHLNISGAKVNDEHILRPVTAIVPKRLRKINRLSAIISGHIHQPQKIRIDPYHIVVGSPICTDFGDTYDKSFVVIDIDAEEGTSVNRINTSKVVTPLVQLEYDFVGQEDPDINVDWDEVEGAGVKVKIRCTQDQHDMIRAGWMHGFEQQVHAKAAFTRPFVLTVVRRKDKTEHLVEADMADDDAVDAWLASRKPTQSKMIKTCAEEALEEAE